MICTGPFRSPDVSHRTKDFEEMLRLVRCRILDYIGSGWELAVIPCSGTGAVEAMIGGLKGNHAMCFINGSYGDRMWGIARQLGWVTGCVNMNFLADLNTYKYMQDFNWMFMVHGETSTGQLNDINYLLNRAETYNKYVALDCVASFVFDEIPFEHERLGAVAFSSNKGLRSMPGVGFVAYRPGLTKDLVDSYYFNLKKWSTEKTPFTPATEIIKDLAERLGDIDYLQTWNNRYKRQALILGYDLKRLGFKSVLDKDAKHMNCLEVIELPCREIKYSLMNYMWDNNIELYDGDDYTVRISIMNLFGDDDNQNNYNYFMKILTEWTTK